MVIAVNFHYIRQNFETKYPSIHGVTPKEFTYQLEILGKLGSFLSQEDLCKRIGNKGIDTQIGIVITFDDGLREQFDFAWDILKQKGIPCIMYINTRPIEEKVVTVTHKIHIIRSLLESGTLLAQLEQKKREGIIEFNIPENEIVRNIYHYDSLSDAKLKYILNFELTDSDKNTFCNQCFIDLNLDEKAISESLYMNKSMLNTLATNDCLGTHGHSHLPLGLIDFDEAINDVSTSINKIFDWTQYAVKSISYPFGFKEACSLELSRYCEQHHNIQFGFTMERRANINFNSPLFLARFSNNDVPGGKNVASADSFLKEVKYRIWYE